MSRSGKLEVGDAAPDFVLKNQKGDKFRLYDFVGAKNIVIFFYVSDSNEGCVKEINSFRDKMTDFSRYDTVVIGISSDSVRSHNTVATEHRVPFVLLSDDKNEIRNAYGAEGAFLPGRITFVIDKRGRMRWHFASQLQYSMHCVEALKKVQQIYAESQEMTLPTS